MAKRSSAITASELLELAKAKMSEDQADRFLNTEQKVEEILGFKKPLNEQEWRYLKAAAALVEKLNLPKESIEWVQNRRQIKVKKDHIEVCPPLTFLDLREFCMACVRWWYGEYGRKREVEFSRYIRMAKIVIGHLRDFDIPSEYLAAIENYFKRRAFAIYATVLDRGIPYGTFLNHAVLYEGVRWVSEDLPHEVV